jgi:sugar phosphate isomerase/epimerase
VTPSIPLPPATADQLSVQLYTLRASIGQDLEATLERVAHIGFHNVELFDFVDRVDEYRVALPGAGLSAPSAHALLVGVDGVDAVFAAAATLGVGAIIDPYVDRARWTTRFGAESVAEDLNGLVDRAAAHGLTLGYHNHEFEFENRIDGTSAFEVFVANLDDRVVVEVDTYWAAVAGEDVPALLARLGNRVRFLHVKDGPLTKVDRDQVAVGSGSLDIPAIIAAQPAALRVVELDDFDGDVYDAVAESFRYLTAEDAR